ncbi:Pyridoxal phosphate transferases superfamily protein [Salvia divinorum]|uniref:Pyridoxal phosphate transferases superfamily protein n=1 Tax=Salvia divinorum TaxID=28513 RepID=A0ABD1IGD1_SALDI
MDKPTNENPENINSPFDTFNPLEPQEFKRQAHLVIDFLVDYYRNVENYPVLSQVGPGYLKNRIPDSAPNGPEPIENILHDALIGSHPRPPRSSRTPYWIGLGKCSGYQSTSFSPEGGGGVIQGSTCDALLSTLVAARDKTLKKIGGNGINKLVAYGSDQTHCTFRKGAQIAGIHRDRIRAIRTSKANAFALSAEDLRVAVEADVKSGLVPFFLCATVGTTASAAVDPLGPLGEVAKEFGIWVHVDGAYAASACICPEYRGFINGVENADSFSFNPHKWLFAGLDCCCLWVKEPAVLVEALSTNPDYLRNKVSDLKKVVDYKDWQISLTRRFRSIKLWILLRSYGVANLQQLIRRYIKMAKDFELRIKTDKRLEVAVPRNFSTVCFLISPILIRGENQVSDDQTWINNLNAKVLESVNESGKIFMTHAMIGGVYVIRIAIGGSLTENKHINLAWEVVKEHVDKAMLLAA